MKLEDMTPEQMEQVKKCETPEECMAFMAENGIELSDELLDSITGGGGQYSAHTPILYCPDGQRHQFRYTGNERSGGLFGRDEMERRCLKCGRMEWA